jgi:hypothetical protein
MEREDILQIIRDELWINIEYGAYGEGIRVQLWLGSEKISQDYLPPIGGE